MCVSCLVRISQVKSQKTEHNDNRTLNHLQFNSPRLERLLLSVFLQARKKEADQSGKFIDTVNMPCSLQWNR